MAKKQTPTDIPPPVHYGEEQFAERAINECLHCGSQAVRSYSRRSGVFRIRYRECATCMHTDKTIEFRVVNGEAKDSAIKKTIKFLKEVWK